ncbi:ice-binding family protein [Haliscomenobacter sp.]|uniref:ice-binding family protein n=1 Tax=Haliscomenobacter sp. TaxID=2717303 RepID=UPI003BA8EDAE
MKTLLHNGLKAIVLLLIPLLGYSQAPNLGSTSSFTLFTAVGAFNNSGVSAITGDIGTNVGAFNLGAAVLIGSSHVADAVSAQAAMDVDLAYGSISPITCDSVIGTTMGGGQILPPNVYCIGAASTISGDLILDGQGDPNSLFIFKIDGALATSIGSRIILTNSASLCNVYFQVNGQVTLGENSLFQGTILANGAIHLLNNATLIGRGLSRSGAINLSANTVTGALPIASTIVASGPTSFCEGDSVTLSGNVGGTWSTGATTPSIIVKTSGDYFVTNEAPCDTVSSNHIIVTVNPLPIPSLISANGPTSFCEGGNVVLSGNVGGTWSTGAITPSIIVTTAGDYFVTNVNACGDTVSNHILVSIDQSQPIASIITISGPNLLCAGDSVVLSGNVGGTWSTGATTSSITVKTSGDYFVTNSNGCGNVVSNHIIVSVNNVDAGEIGTSQNLCVGAPSPTLTATTAASGSGLLSYVWQFNTIGCSGPWNSVANSNSPSFNPGGTVSVTTYYRVIVSSSIDDGDGGAFVCSDTSNCVVITANDVDAGSLISDVDSICAGGSVAIDSIGTTGTLTYFVFTNGLVTASFSTLSQLEDYLSTAAPGEYCVYTIAYAGLNGGCGNVAGLSLAEVIAACLEGQCYDISEPLCILVTAPPLGAIALQGPALSCEDDGSVIQVVLSASGLAAPYDFYYSDIITSLGPDCLPRAVGGTFVTLNEADSTVVLTYTGANPGTYTITLDRVVDANGCEDTTRRSVTFTIAAKPVGKDSSRTINNCTSVNTNLQNIIACQQASTFTWYSVASIGSNVAYNNPNVSGETINPVGTGSVITDFLSNTSNVNQTIIYRVVPTSVVGACVGEPFYISITVRPRVLVTCLACVSQVNVSLDANCRFLVTPNVVLDGFAQCENGQVLLSALEVLISDGNNDSYINCAGTYTYVVRLKAEYAECFSFEPCWGKITAEDKTAPALICAPADVTLDCYDVNYVLNNRLTIGNVGATSSPRPAATSSQTINNAEGVAGTGDACNLGLIPPALVSDNIKNLGYAYFKDNCYNCGCRITLKWSDKVVFYACTDPELRDRGIYATISREWVATDCNGMSSSYVQKIHFTRPDLDDFVFNGPGEGKYNRVVTYNSCTPDKSLIKKEDVTPYICSYFNTSANPRCLFIDQVECNYSISIKDTEFPICGGKGVKIDREIYVFDWCAGGIVDTFHVLIKIGDFTAPTVEYAHGAPYDISTGPMDCTAAIPVTVAGIKSAFGVTIKDNCTLGNISVSVYTKDRYVKGILVYEGPEDPFCDNARKSAELRGDNDAYRLGTCDITDICWDKVEYAVMNGMMIGLPVGKHLMVIDAFDACYNASITCFIFEVKDKIAPVMKCDDDLHVSLSNANGYTNGYAQVSAEDIDEGSWDNCKLAWIAVRRNVPDACAASFIAKGYDTNGNGKLDALPADGDVSKADGFDLNGDGDIADFGETFILKGGKLMTPLLDYVEFFCCDLSERVTVELWGGDIYGNTNYCWMDLLIEDKVAPTCIAPWAITIDCDDKNLALIDDKKAAAAAFGDVTITTGNDCGSLDTTYTTVKNLKCGAGYIDRTWTLTKQTVKGPIAISCTQRITIKPVHEYNICFPKDVSTDCKTPIIDTVITDELACDILAVNVSDKRYDASDDECYKIFRTYSVINWCTYDDRCGDPLLQTNISIIPRDVFGNYGKAPIYVLVRDRERGVRDGVEEFYISKDLIHANADDIRFTPPYCTVAGEFYHSFIYTQIIKVYDDTRPVVTADPGKFCIREGGDCLANLKMVITGKDNCSDKVTLETQYLMIAPGQTLDASKMILYATPRWSTKDLGNGQFEINVANLPQGKHDLIVVVRDECGNLSVATRIPFTVEDCKGPAPICINGLSTELMPDGAGGGMMAVWASDFVASKIYDCNGQGPETKDGLKLVTKYSINRVGSPVVSTQTGINLTCADKGKVILVELHAWDEAGKDDFCVTYVEVQDNRSVCPGSATGTVSIAGTISTEGNANLQGASITLSGSTSQNTTTAANGAYSFINLIKGGDFTIAPQLDKNHLNGVSTFDLVLIQKHILGVTALNSPYKMIAADVNNSKSISTLDLIALRKLILNIDTHFANNTSWRFIDAAYNFPQASNPWSASFPEVVSINDIPANATANFVAIKMGDVNASASVSAAATAEVRTNGTLNIQAAEAALKAGQEYSVEFNAADLKSVQGYQFALSLDKSKVELLDIVYGVAKAENFGVFQNEGVITTSWNGDFKQGALFTLVLRAKADAQLSNTLSLNRVVSAEAYSQNNEQLGVALQFGKAEALANGFELKQNTPNPFNGETLISFNLPKASAATLTISDVTGRVLKSIRADYAKGFNQVILKAADLNATGVLYYTLEVDDFTATRKMVLLK